MPILLTLVVLLSISDSTVAKKEEALVGTWNVVHCSSNTPGLPPSLIQETRVEALSSEYTFHADGAFSMRSRLSRKGEAGIWSFDPQTNTLALYYASGHRSPEYYFLTSMEDARMIWDLDLGPSGNVILTLQKGNPTSPLTTAGEDIQ